MKSHVYHRIALLAALAVCLSGGCDDNPAAANCPADPISLYGPLIPGIAHKYPALSPDARQLAYIEEQAGRIKVLDLRTGVSRTIDIKSHLAENVSSMGCSRVIWSPYDNTVLMAHCADITDTGSVTPMREYGQNYYRISLATGDVRRVTPSTYGPTGSEHGLGAPLWLRGSTPSLDSILSFYYKSPFPSSTWKTSTNGVYLLQRDTLLSTTYPAVISQSKSGRHLASVVAFSEGPVHLYVDGYRLMFDRPYAMIDYASWSPDETRLALSIALADGNRELWIIDVERWLRNPSQTPPVSVINLRNRYCKLSRWGIDAEFLTNTTLAVSIHDLGDEGSYLWEIRDDGTILRQLTSR